MAVAWFPLAALLVHATGALERPRPRTAEHPSGQADPTLSRRLLGENDPAGRGGLTAKVPDYCVDTDGLAAEDSWGAGCAWYRENPTWCGDSADFDDQDFTAKVQCCVCDGGSRCLDTDAGAQDSWGNSCEWYDRNVNRWRCTERSHCVITGKVPNSRRVGGLETRICEEYRHTTHNDLDRYGCTCYFYYYDYYYDCRDFDDEDFTRADMCCACAGGQRGWTSIPASFYDYCQDFATVDENENGCDWYEALHWCPEEGPFDDEDFSPSSACCSCGGGDSRSHCQDFVAADKNGNGCDWYEALLWCPEEGPFDDEDFSPGSACCSCGGGATSWRSGGWAASSRFEVQPLASADG